MNKRRGIELIPPGWDAPANVKAVTGGRFGGVSAAPYDSLNLAMHVGDDPGAVAANRRALQQRLALDAAPCWLRQTHGAEVVNVADLSSGDAPRGDAWVCFETGRAVGVLTADCLPVFFCDYRGTRIGLVHAGWRGLAAGVIEATVAALDCAPSSLMAWLGPVISAHAYRVGDEVRDVFARHNEADALAFMPDNTGKWHADLSMLAANRLRRLGIAFRGGRHCTCYDSERFYSYRRDGHTGRNGHLIWLVDGMARLKNTGPDPTL